MKNSVEKYQDRNLSSRVEGNPQGVIDVLLAPIDGFYDHNSCEAAAIDVSPFILIIGGFLGRQ